MKREQSAERLSQTLSLSSAGGIEGLGRSVEDNVAVINQLLVLSLHHRCIACAMQSI